MGGVFANLNASLPRLIPKPEPVAAAPVFAPLPAQESVQQGLAPIASAPALPNVFHPLTPEEEIGQSLKGRLESDYQKDLHPWGTPGSAHPGVFGKIAHALNHATGGDTRRMWEEERLEKRAEDLSKLESAEGLQGAQVGNLESETGKNTEETKEMPEKAKSEEALQGATTRHTNDVANALENPPPNLPNAYAHAVLDAVKRGVDPAQDSNVQYIEKAIQATQKAPPPKGLEHVAGIANGRPAMANFHPDTGVYTDPDTGQVIKGFQPQPNYAQMVPLILSSKTTSFINPETNLPEDTQYNPKTQTFDRPLGLSASNAYGHEAAQAGAIDRAGDKLIQSVEQNRNKIGNMKALIQSAILGTPWADPATAGLRTQIGTFAALQPSMHGFKGAQAMQEFEKLLGGIPNNPDALIASINSIKGTAGAINPQLERNANWEATATDKRGHEVGYRGGKWYDVKTGKEIQ